MVVTGKSCAALESERTLVEPRAAPVDLGEALVDLGAAPVDLGEAPVGPIPAPVEAEAF